MITLTESHALWGHTDDAGYADHRLLLDTRSGPAKIVAILRDGETEPFVLPGYAGEVCRTSSGDWVYYPPPHVVVGGCGFCGGNIVIPHGHAFGACHQCGAI